MNTRTNRKCHSSFVTFDLWLRCTNLANEIPFFWHVALTKGFSLDFKWDLDFGYFFLALSFLFFTYLIHCFQYWKIWNTELFVLKSASNERSAFFACNRLHWLPKDDCIFAVGFLKMTTLKTQQWILEQTENAIHLLSHSICDCDAWTWLIKFLSSDMLHLQKVFL